MSVFFVSPYPKVGCTRFLYVTHSRAIERKLLLFDHICRMEDNIKLKTLMFRIVDGTNKRGRPCREWMDDIVTWCKTGLQELNSLAQNRRRWKLVTRQAMDTKGRWSHGS